MADQEQFLEVIDRDEAQLRFEAALDLSVLPAETIDLASALGRVLAEDVIAHVNVPSFDRSNFDGFAVQAADTHGASEESPREIELLPDTVTTAVVPACEIESGRAVAIATGAMIPRGADAIVMVEHADVSEKRLAVRRGVASGFGIAFAGTDVSYGELVLHRGETLTSRETGVLASVGQSTVNVVRRPRVAVISTGDEIIAPTEDMRPPMVFDSNARIISDAIRESGAEALELGIAIDDEKQLKPLIEQALSQADCVVLSGGTSKGEGDLSYRVVQQMTDPGILVHGVALKPGKPICLAAHHKKPVVILPGFPTSAIFTFHEFVAPVIRRLAGQPLASRRQLPARLAVKLNSEIGRTEYVLVGLVSEEENATADRPAYTAFPMGKGSGSVTTFSQADGFFSIDRHTEIIDAGTTVDVQMLARELQPADLVVIGSHCIGLDFLLGQLRARGVRIKFMAVGSTAGLDAAKHARCDLAGIHLLDPNTNRYNEPFLDDSLCLIRGYGRRQGLVHRKDDERLAGLNQQALIERVKTDTSLLMVNRNGGSGTRLIIDQYLSGAKPRGYAIQAKNHHAVVASVRQGRADWGIAIETAMQGNDLRFVPLIEEQYDFAVPKSRVQREPVQQLLALLTEDEVRTHLTKLGFSLPSSG